MEKLIYIAEDEGNIRELVQYTLESYGYRTEGFETADEMLARLEEKIPDLILLDIMMPGIDGVEALRLIRSRRETKRTPVIFITAKSTEIDKVRGLDAGADDYITKPFGLLELSARVRGALRRGEPDEEKEEQRLSAGGLVMDVQNREVFSGGEPVELTYKEFELLHMLMASKGRVVSREELLDKIWGYDYVGETRTLDMHIRTLRSKIGDSADNPKYIKTVRGVGYRFIAASKDEEESGQ